uniref:EF-hand domain-containing protein n=1 Tax=Noctiluca scintillans TaxID=2966 RepID=A0A7S0ZYP7_NOCSC
MRQQQQLDVQQRHLERTLAAQRTRLCGAMEETLRRSVPPDEKRGAKRGHTVEFEIPRDEVLSQRTASLHRSVDMPSDESVGTSERGDLPDCATPEDDSNAEERLVSKESARMLLRSLSKSSLARDRKKLTTAQRWNDIEATLLKPKIPGTRVTTASQADSRGPSETHPDSDPHGPSEEEPVGTDPLVAQKSTQGRHVMMKPTWSGVGVAYIEERSSRMSVVLGFVRGTCAAVTESLGKKHLNCTLLRSVVVSRCFAITICALILSNACFIAVSTDHTIRTAFDEYDKLPSASVETPDWMKFGDIVFIVAFIVELLVRILALEGEFLVGPAWPWNIFDALLTISSCLELALIAVNLDLSYIRVLRLARIARSFRVFHLLKWASLVRSLRLMLFAIVKSVVPFVWAVLVLFLIIFVFAVVLSNGVTNYVRDVGAGTGRVEDLKDAFGSMPRMVLTLFLSISGGRDWWEVLELFFQLPAVYSAFFLFFMLVLVLAVLNIITGIFVKEAMDMAHLDRDLQMQLELEENRYFLKKLKLLFERIDADGGGTMSLEEFEAHMESDELRVLFSLLGLDVQDAVSFFKVLDVDGSNELQIEDFVMGCMRHKGNSTMDLECSVMDIKKMLKKQVVGVTELGEQVQRIASSLHTLRSQFDIDFDGQEFT